MPPSTLILFDIDGTLIKTDGAGRRAMVRSFGEVFGSLAVGERASAVPFAGKTDPTIFEGVAAALAIDSDRFARDRERLVAVYLEALADEMRRPERVGQVLPGVRPLLDALERIPEAHLGLLTGNLEAGARTKLEVFDLNRYFPGGGFGSDHADRREIARVARSRLSRLTGIEFDRERVVVIGDTDHDVDCARANGFTAVAVATGWGSRESLEAAAPDVLLPDLAHLGNSLAALGLTAGA